MSLAQSMSPQQLERVAAGGPMEGLGEAGGLKPMPKVGRHVFRLS
jgi:hypothetical protein